MTVDNFFIHAPAERAPGLALNANKMVIIEVVTENTGADVMADNKRVLAVVMGDSTKQDLFYADANEGDRSLFGAAMQINALIAKNYVLAGHNVKGYELQFLRRFLNLNIPEYMTLDLRDLDGVIELQQRPEKPVFKLEDVLAEYKIPLDHRRPIDEKAELLKKKPELIAQADAAAQQLASSKGWSQEFSRQYALNNMATGQAILESYEEFVQKGGSSDTAFFKYAAGDVIAEHKLIEALRKPKAATSPKAAPPA